MTTKPRKIEIRWPSAAVLIVGICAVAAVYVLVPEHREEIALGVGGLFTVVLAFMRRIVGLGAVAALALAIAVPSCTPAQKEAFERTVERTMLSALELAAKVAGRVLLSEAERALKFDTSGGENP